MTDIVLSELTRIWKAYPMFYVAFAAFLVAWKTLLTNAKATKIKNSIDFESSYKHKDSIKKSSDKVLELITSHENTDELNQKLFEISIKQDRTVADSDYIHINDFLNEWERCANGVYYGVYDEKFLYGTYAGTLTTAFMKLLPFILMRQGGTRERVYIKTEWLALKWIINQHKEKGLLLDTNLEKSYRLLCSHHKAIYGHPIKRTITKYYRTAIRADSPSEELHQCRKLMITYLVRK